jgi:lysozyme
MKNMVKIVITLFCLVSLYLYSKTNLHFTKNEYDSKNYIQGIDISHYQGKINWSKINKSKIKFVIIKSTEGKNNKDKQFKRNWSESRKRNFIVGAYHRFTLKSSGKSQAKNFISMVPKSSNSMPPLIDIENINISKVKDKTIFIKELKILENELYKHYGKKPIFYLNEYNYYDYIINNFNNNIWIYDHSNTSPVTLNYKKGIWQYTTKGRCSGINGYIDMNYFNGNLSEFKEFIQ